MLAKNPYKVESHTPNFNASLSCNTDLIIGILLAIIFLVGIRIAFEHGD